MASSSAVPIIASASDDEIAVWETGSPSEDPLVAFEPHDEPITCLRWTSNDRVLASGSHDGTIALSEASGKLFHTLQTATTPGGPGVPVLAMR